MDEHTLKRVGKRIEKLRLRHFNSQDDAAYAGGTSRPSWDKVEKGAPNVRDSTLVAVDRAFGWPTGTTEDLREGRLSEAPEPTNRRHDPRSIEERMDELERQVAAIRAAVEPRRHDLDT